MKKCPLCNKVWISDEDEYCINCSYKRELDDGGN